VIPAPLFVPAVAASAFPGFVAALTLRDKLGILGLVIGLFLSIGSLVGVFYGVKWKTAADAEHDAYIAVKHLASAQEARLGVSQVVSAEYRQKLDERDALLVELRERLATAEKLPNMTGLLKILKAHDSGAKKRDLATAKAVQAATEALERLLARETTAISQSSALVKATDTLTKVVDNLEGHCPYLSTAEVPAAS
jgi:uncharacterized UPF0160 family protein